MRNLAMESLTAKLDDVISQRIGEICAGADICNYFQPRTDVCQPIPTQRTRDVQIFSARLAAQWRRNERRVGNRRCQNRGHENDITENYAWAGERPGFIRNLEDACADQ